jgi:Condensin complex subunit 2
VQLNYVRRRKPVNAAELKSLLWESFQAHRSAQTAETATESTLKQPELVLLPADVSPEEVDWQDILNDVQDGSWGKVEDSSVHMCFFLTLVLANEKGLRLRDAGSLEQGHRIMIRQDKHVE